METGESYDSMYLEFRGTVDGVRFILTIPIRTQSLTAW